MSIGNGPEKWMKYLCLVYQEESSVAAYPDGTCDATEGEALDHCEELKRSGHLIVSSALQSVKAATTVRVRNGRVSITDGPYAETKEQLGGFYLIEARDLNDAIRVASKMPSARQAYIEIRPVSEVYSG